MLRRGIEAADHILSRAFQLNVAKALDPLNDNDFMVIIRQLSDSLRGLSGAAEAIALARALDVLDVDWLNMGEGQRDRVIEAAKVVLAKPPVSWPELEQRFVLTGERVVGGVRQRVHVEFSNKVGVDLTATDKKVSAYAAKSNAAFVRDQYGKRAEAASELARKIVAKGLDEGWGREELGQQLAQQLGAQGLARSQSYYNMVAAAHIGRARSYGALASYDDAGVEEYEFMAMMDEVTTEQCRFMHGRRFPVAVGLQKLVEAADLEDPESVKTSLPWMSSGKDENGNQVLYLKGADGSREVVAGVSQGGVGYKDRAGTYATTHSNASLAARGLSTPPLHGNCRSTTIPVT